jgi:hypothetical protein
MELIVAALATWQIIEIWHHSLLFAGRRAVVETWTGKLGELLVCCFCLSPWVALLCVLILQSQGTGLVVWFAKAVIMALAAARLANLGNDYFYTVCRTPKFSLDDLNLEEESEKDE